MEEESCSSLSIVAEAPGLLRIYEDGTVERLIDEGTVPPSSQLGNNESEGGVESKDVVIDPQTGVFVRLFLPPLQVSDGKQKVPVLVYIHGGAFCIGSAISSLYHNYVSEVATEAKVICVSVEYRKAPEHRLPAGYDDCLGVLEWLHRQRQAEGVPVDPWLACHADFSKVFLAGDSAGGNMVHQVGILASGRNWDGLRLQGAILVHPAFGGEALVGREVGPQADTESFKEFSDAIWGIVLPEGADKDHPFSNPIGPRSPHLSTLVYERMLVFVAEKDLLTDRAVLYYEGLKKAGKDADLVLTEGEGHVFHLFDPKSQNAFPILKRMSDFMHSSPSSSDESKNPTQNLSV